MIKKNTKAIFLDGNFKGEYNWEGGIPLFSLFKSVDLVEKVGSGIERIRGAMRNAKLSDPEFVFTNFFTVVFKRPFIS